MARATTYCNPVSDGKNELARKTSIKGSGAPTSTLAISRALILTSAPALVSAPGLLGKYINKNLQRATKLA